MPYRITQCYLPPDRGDIPAFTPAEAGTRLSDPGGMQGWVDIVGLLHTKMVYSPEDDHPSKYWPGRTCINFVHATNSCNHYAMPLTMVWWWWWCLQTASLAYSISVAADDTFVADGGADLPWNWGSLHRDFFHLVYLFAILNSFLLSASQVAVLVLKYTHTRLTDLFPGLPRWAGTRKLKPIWILLKQETVSCSGISWAICNSAPRSRRFRVLEVNFILCQFFS